VTPFTESEYNRHHTRGLGEQCQRRRMREILSRGMSVNNGKVYLKQDVLVQPLFNRWYAWSGLVAPATAAMFAANSHLKIMQSFVSAPQVHVSALKNPALRGGPFINYDAGRVPDIKTLMEETIREQSDLLEFAAAIRSLSETLAGEANGYSLEPLYEKVPNVLKGYIELVYDLNNSPSIRFIEGLLYNSPYYKEASQSIALSLCENDERPFVLSTPVLARDGTLHLSIPFRAEALDELFKMKFEPQPLAYVKEILNLNESELALSSSFFTEEPRESFRYEEDAVRIRYFGHACILIESKGTSIMIDPLVSYENKAGIPRFTYSDLPPAIDYVLITHSHQDHCVLETLLQLRHKIKNVIVPKNNGGGLADPSLKLVLRNLGFKQVSELDEMETIEIDGGSITGLPFLGEHADLNIRTKLAHLVTLRDRSILCAADSNNVEPKLYEHIQRMVGDVDILFLGMECDGGPLSWLYGPLLTKPFARKLDQSRRLNGSDYEKGMDIIKRLHPTQVYVYAMGQEPWLTYLTSIQYTQESHPIIDSNKLIQDCRSRGLISERLYGQKEIRI
jgi:L-ascorbate metabolism protein UlaG (beta-lactamase superfamily)